MKSISTLQELRRYTYSLTEEQKDNYSDGIAICG